MIVITNEQACKLADALYWPECWDTIAYPTLFDALAEFISRNSEYCDIRKPCPVCGQIGFHKMSCDYKEDSDG
jgi:hypothetical protein